MKQNIEKLCEEISGAGRSAMAAFRGGDLEACESAIQRRGKLLNELMQQREQVSTMKRGEIRERFAGETAELVAQFEQVQSDTASNWNRFSGNALAAKAYSKASSSSVVLDRDG